MVIDDGARWERRPGERPGEILTAALSVFASRGYRNTKLEDVAESAGVTKGTIYHYFTSKEELLLRAIEDYHEQALGRTEAAMLGAGASASAQLRAMVTTWFGEVRTEQIAIATLFLQDVVREAPDAHTQWLAQGPVRAAEVIAGIVQTGQASGEFRPDADAQVAASVLIAGLLLQTVWQQHADTVPTVRITQARLVESSLDLFLHGLYPVATHAT